MLFWVVGIYNLAIPTFGFLLVWGCLTLSASTARTYGVAMNANISNSSAPWYSAFQIASAFDTNGLSCVPPLSTSQELLPAHSIVLSAD